MEGVLIPTNPLLNMQLTARVTFEIFKNPISLKGSGYTPTYYCDSCFLVDVKSAVLWICDKTHGYAPEQIPTAVSWVSKRDSMCVSQQPCCHHPAIGTESYSVGLTVDPGGTT